MRTRKVTCPKCKKPFRPGGPWPSDDPELTTAKQASERFELGRNFANKLWNAARFLLLNLDGYTPQARATWRSCRIEDRWILSRLATTTAAVTRAARRLPLQRGGPDALRLHLVGVLRLVRRDAQGPAARTTARERSRTRRRAARAGRRARRHPAAGAAGHAVRGRVDLAGARRGGLRARLARPEPATESVVIAPWPSYPASWQRRGDGDAHRRMQELVRAVREVRNRYTIDPKNAARRVRALRRQRWRPTSATLAPFITLLAGVGQARVRARRDEADAGRQPCDAEFEVYVSLEGLIDVAAEVKRLEKQLAEKRKHLAGTQAKLDNPDFVSRAPAEVVEQQREQVVELQKQIATIEVNMRDLQI